MTVRFTSIYVLRKSEEQIFLFFFSVQRQKKNLKKQRRKQAENSSLPLGPDSETVPGGMRSDATFEPIDGAIGGALGGGDGGNSLSCAAKVAEFGPFAAADDLSEGGAVGGYVGASLRSLSERGTV